VYIRNAPTLNGIYVSLLAILSQLFPNTRAESHLTSVGIVVKELEIFHAAVTLYARKHPFGDFEHKVKYGCKRI
jgi:hypothetical protein